MVCNAFGGLAKTGSYTSGDYSVLDYCSDDYDTDVPNFLSGVVVSLDTFKGGVIDNIYSTVKEYHLFSNNGLNSLNGGLIDSYSVVRKTAKATYGKPYGTQIEHYIYVEFGNEDFDSMCQMMASPAIAVVSCDTDFPTSISFSNECDNTVYGGGSCNPIARMGVVMDDTIEVGLNRDTYKVKIKLLG
jgi:hypothetical protein